MLVGLGVVALFVARDPRTYLLPELWAEDAVDFLAGPLHHGASSIVRPITLNFHVLGRAIAWAAARLPGPWTPWIYAWSSALVFAAVATTFLRDDHAWLHEKRGVRALFVLALAAVPGTSEVVGSINCLPYVLAFWLATLLLRRPLRVGPLDGALIVVVGFSTSFALLPLSCAVLLYALRRDVEVGKVALLLLGPVALNTISNVAHVFEAPDGVVYEHRAEPWSSRDGGLLPATYVWLQRGAVQLVAAPLLGGPLVEELMPGPLLFPLALPGLAALLSQRARRGDVELVILTLAFCGFYSLVWLARSYTDMLRLSEGLSLWNSRYGFVLGPYVALLWWRTAADLHAKQRVAAYALGLLLVVNHAAYWLPRVRGPRVDPTPVLRAIDDTRAAMRAGALPVPQLTPVIPLQPEGWARARIEIRVP